MKTLIAFLIAVFTMSVFSGCSEDSATPNTYTIQNVFPLKVGNKWTYQNTYYNLDGSIDTTNGSDSVIFLVDSAIVYNSIPAYAMTIVEKSIMYYLNTDLFMVDQFSGNPRLILRYPMNINETILIKDTTYSSGGRSKNILRYVSDNVSITVPAGTFNCINYEQISLNGEKDALDTTFRSNIYLSFGIGLIKEDSYRISNVDSTWHRSYTSVLTSYSKQP